MNCHQDFCSARNAREILGGDGIRMSGYLKKVCVAQGSDCKLFLQQAPLAQLIDFQKFPPFLL